MWRWGLLAFVPAALGCGDNGHFATDAETALADAAVIDAPADVANVVPATLAVTDTNGLTITQLDLGTQMIGAADTASLHVSNIGAGSTSLALSITGAASGDFAIDAAGTNCGSSLLPSQTCTVAIDFAPSASGPRMASLAIYGDGGTMMEVPLTGTGVIGPLTFVPASYDFGTVQITQSGATMIELQNVSASDAPIDAIDVTGGEFALTG